MNEKDLLKEFSEYILSKLRKGDEVHVRNLGTFRVYGISPHRFRNVNTGMIETTKKSLAVGFKASRNLINKIKNG